MGVYTIIRRFLLLILGLLAIIAISGCYDLANPVDPDADNYQGYRTERTDGAAGYTILYNANGADTGSVPVDGVLYTAGDAVTVRNNTGLLSLTGSSFIGWNSAADGSGTHYTPWSSFSMPAQDLVFFAEWTTAPVYTVTYDANGGVDAPTDSTSYLDATSAIAAVPGAMSVPGGTFVEWNTASDGSGTAYAPGDPIPISGGGVTLWAHWLYELHITYYSNGATGGTVPVDSTIYYDTDPATISGQGTLVYMQDGISLRFTGWDTLPGGTGTHYDTADLIAMGPADLDLYAQWDVIGGTGPAGGLVFYDKGVVSNGWRYLEASAADLSGGDPWGTPGAMLGATDTLIGSGGQNTALIVESVGAGSYAAKQAADSTEGGYNDWFLPNATSLTEIYTQLYIGLGEVTFSPNIYWASDEDDPFNANSVNFSDGSVSPQNKADSYRLRAVRAFSSAAASYPLIYDRNNADSGSVPVDYSYYESGQNAVVQANPGMLDRAGFAFTGWNEDPSGFGANYVGGQNFSMTSSGYRVLYAEWAPYYQLIYETGSYADGGSVPSPQVDYLEGDMIMILDNLGGLTRTDYTFVGWNTADDGSGTDYTVGQNLPMPPMVLQLFPKWEPNFVGGDGTSLTPYLINSPVGLDAMRNDLTAEYKLTSDIDLNVAPWNSGSGWTPVGTSGSQFTGVFDGNNHTISNLFINRSSLGTGFFGYIEDAEIKNVRLVNVDITNGANNTGALAGGQQTLPSTITNCSATGSVTSTGYNNGGLVGFSQNGTFIQCFADVSVISGDNAGGLVGNASSGNSITDSYAVGDVSGVDWVGGLVGMNSAAITNSYAAGLVTASGTSGGLFVPNGGSATNSFYDQDSTGQSSGEATGLFSPAMIVAASFDPPWDFSTIWQIDEGVSYPYLQWQGGVNIPLP